MRIKRFSYCPDAMVPEIPYVQDVLFALGLSKEQKHYDFCRGNHTPYVDNVQLVIDKVGAEAKSVCEDKATRIIAKAILDLCPEQAKCLLNTAFVEANIMAGKGNWWEVLKLDRGRLRQSCFHCRVSQ